MMCAPVCERLLPARRVASPSAPGLSGPCRRQTCILAQEDGSPLQPNSLTHEFVRLLAKDPILPRVRYHDLRHSHATHMLASGVHPKVAQERLGHSNVGITLDLYSHVLPGMQADAAAKVDASIRAAIEGPPKAKGSKAVASTLF